MFPMPIKMAVATALAGAALASAATVANAYPVTGGGPGDSYQDLRSPDAVDAARPFSSAAMAVQDLRSPDSRDRGEGYAPVLESQPVVDEPSPATGFDVPSAAIGAAAGTGVVILLLAAGGVARRRPVRVS